MATFYDALPLAVIKQLVKAELMQHCRTTEVEIHGIEFDDNLYGYDEDPAQQELLQRLTVKATITGSEECFRKDYGTHPWWLEWSADMAQFTQSARADQDDDEACN